MKLASAIIAAICTSILIGACGARLGLDIRVPDEYQHQPPELMPLPNR